MTNSDQLTLFAGASPASPGASPDSSEAPTTTVISGRKCCELLPLLGLDGCLARMSAALFRTRWASTEFSLTWKLSATPARRSVFRLVPSMRRTSGIACGSWPTPQERDHRIGMEERAKGEQSQNGRRVNLPDYAAAAWPTPSAGQHNYSESPEQWNERRERLKAKGINGNGAGMPLGIAAQQATCPTPSARDHKSGLASAETMERNARPHSGQTGLAEQATGATPNGSGASSTSAGGGALCPAFVEFLMGYPEGWTEI